MSAKNKSNKARKPKPISLKVVTQCNYFKEKRLNLSRGRLHKAVGADPNGGTVDKYINKLKHAGFVENIEGKNDVYKVLKMVPKDFEFNS